jgi:hypothetical protein
MTGVPGRGQSVGLQRRVGPVSLPPNSMPMLLVFSAQSETGAAAPKSYDLINRTGLGKPAESAS